MEEEEHSPFSVKDGWQKSNVSVRIPKEGVRYASEEDVPVFTLEDVWYRPFREVIQSALKQTCVREWHMVPHRLFVVASREGRVQGTHRSPSPALSTLSSTLSSSIEIHSSFMCG